MVRYFRGGGALMSFNESAATCDGYGSIFSLSMPE
jgi:hypothetical protein